MVREEALSMLQREGFNMDKVLVKSSSNMLCRIEEIEEEFDRADYDAVVMGRRGQNRLKDFLQKSLSRRFLERRPDVPLILCRRPDVNRKDILLCVDGSPSSRNMAEFVAAMADTESHLVTLCNIVRDTSDDRDNAAKIFNECEDLMLKSGFDADRLRHMIYPSDYAPRAILDNVHWGKFAAVAVGASASKNPLSGPVSDYLFNELSGAALWIHP
jgi:hypothetical protein